MSWYEYAACRGEDPELFFPIGANGQALSQLREAKRVCAGCSVQSLCLEWAVLAGIDHGVWGGLSEQERRTVRRRADRQAARLPSPFVDDALVGHAPNRLRRARSPSSKK
jgi:WhiB family redox-sensing transcriptional regulator